METTYGNLYIPQIQVFWGDIELTRYPLVSSVTGNSPDLYESLVYDVSVSLQESGQTPSGRMKWNPSGAAYDVLADILANQSKSDAPIIVVFYFKGKRSISFKFVFSGISENYGNDMSLEIKLASELDGLITANIKSVAQTDENGIEMLAAVEKLKTFFGLDGINEDIVAYTSEASVDLKEVKVQANYAESTSFVQALENLVEQNGNLVFYSNIRDSMCVIYAPYSMEKSTVVYLHEGSDPDPKLRHGYFIGPTIIDTITKTSEWQPTQKTQYNVTGKKAKIQPGVSVGNSQSTSTVPQSNQASSAAAAARASGASGSFGSASRPGSRLAKNEKGEKKKIALNEERASKLSASVFMCPALLGVKPHDIIFIPSLKGDFMEDWIVNSVEYQQTDGGAELSIQASRKYGWGTLMNPAGEKWLKYANAIGLVGENSSIDNWTAYSWGVQEEDLPATNTSASSQASSQASTPSPEEERARRSLSIVPKQFIRVEGNNAVVIDYGFELFLRESGLVAPGEAQVVVPVETVGGLFQVYLGRYR